MCLPAAGVVSVIGLVQWLFSTQEGFFDQKISKKFNILTLYHLENFRLMLILTSGRFQRE